MKFSRAMRMLLSLSLVALAAPLFAQQTGTIVGKVTDSAGGVLPGVTVEARSNVLPGPRTTVTSGSGDYRLPALPPGNYTITFTLSGMQAANRKAFVQLSQETTADVKMAIGGLSEAVTVTAENSFVDKDTATVATGLSTEQLNGLPTGTEYRDLMKLIPGIQYTQETTRGPSSGGSGQDNVYQFDGVNVTLPLFGTLAAEPATQDIAQVTVIRGGARAVDFDRSGGFSVDSVSKSGTDKLFGQVSYRVQNHNMSAALKSGSLSRFEQDRAWTDVNLGGPLLKDRLYFFGSYFRPTNTRQNRANLYGPLPEYSSKRNEGFGKLTFTPRSSVLLNFSYRQSKRLEKSDLFASNAAATTGTGSEIRQKIYTGDGSWVINAKSYATFKFTRFENPNISRPDNEAGVTPSTAAGTRLDITNLDKLGRLTVPAPVAGSTAYNTFIQPLIDRYGYTLNGAKVGGGIVGFGSEFNDQSFFRTAAQLGYNLTVGGSVRHDIHFGYQRSVDSEKLIRSSNGFGLISVPGGRLAAVNGQLPFYTARIQSQSAGTAAPIKSEYHAQSFEFNDTIHYKDWAFNVGLLASNDTLFGQGLAEDSSALSGFVLKPGNKYEMYDIPFSKMLQPRVGATWSYNGKDTVYASYARYNPVATSLPRAAAWDRGLTGTFVDLHFDANGLLFAAVPVGSSAGKLFVQDMTPRTTNEYLVGTARSLNNNLTMRVYGRHRKSTHFWEDTPNNERLITNAPANVPKELYISDLTARLAQIGSPGATYVIADLDTSYSKYFEGTVELEWRSTKTVANFSYTRSHYYGNFDQDNSTTVNDANVFIGSSNIADAPGRQLWDNKNGNLRGDRPHMLKVSGFRSLKWNATAGAFFVFQSGQPWESWSYEPYRAVTTSTSDTIRYAEPAGSRRADSHYQLDFNYTQDIKLSGRFKLQLVGNVFNVFDKQTGYNYQPSVHDSTFGLPRNFFDPRRLEVTARLRF